MGAQQTASPSTRATRSCIWTRAAASRSSRAPASGRSCSRHSPRTTPAISTPANLGVRLALRRRADLYVGYAITKDTGDGRATAGSASVTNPVQALVTSVQTFPLTYQSPLARLSVRITPKLRWNAGWQFYDYARGLPPLRVQPELRRAHRIHERALELLSALPHHPESRRSESTPRLTPRAPSRAGSTSRTSPESRPPNTRPVGDHRRAYPRCPAHTGFKSVPVALRRAFHAITRIAPMRINAALNPSRAQPSGKRKP